MKFRRIFFTPSQIFDNSPPDVQEPLVCIVPSETLENIARIIIHDEGFIEESGEEVKSFEVNCSQETIQKAQKYYNSLKEEEKLEIVKKIEGNMTNEEKVSVSFSIVVALNYIVSDELKVLPFSDELVGALVSSSSVWKEMFFKFWKLWSPVFIEEKVTIVPEKSENLKSEENNTSVASVVSNLGNSLGSSFPSILTEGGKSFNPSDIDRIKQKAIQEIYDSKQKAISEIESKHKENNSIFDDYSLIKNSLQIVKERIDKLEQQVFIILDFVSNIVSKDKKV
ncbi:MAG: hypothetical protein QW350_05290 [Candidatus Aenigmatarchaeota archaeon]